MTDLVPPGHQAALFAAPVGHAQYRVVDHAGITRLTTTALGVAFAVAQRVAADSGTAWITNVDGSAARIGRDGKITTATPRPWIDTISHANGGNQP